MLLNAQAGAEVELCIDCRWLVGSPLLWQCQVMTLLWKKNAIILLPPQLINANGKIPVSSMLQKLKTFNRPNRKQDLMEKINE
jgi:hypothetical protein